MLNLITDDYNVWKFNQNEEKNQITIAFNS